jgi:tRNA modification GTPase
LTPPGVAALASLAVRGPKAWEVARAIFHPRARGQALPADPTPGQFWFGRLGDEVADEVVLAVKRLQPDPWIELHCHGGREVVRLILEILESHGARTVTWQELEVLTDADPLRARAAATLAEALTARTASILLDQYHGALRRALDAVVNELKKDDLRQAGPILADLARYADVGRHLTTPWRVAVAGAPNVGKSSLVNALAGYQRSIVAPMPGTTRDVVTTRIAIDGWPVELSDTAGLRTDAEAIEEQGVGMARAAASGADLCLWVVDASVPPVWPDAAVSTSRTVVNKIDLAPAWDFAAAAGAVRVSALTGSGIAELCQALSVWLVPAPPPAGAALPFTPALCDQVATARELLTAGRGEEAAHTLVFD